MNLVTKAAKNRSKTLKKKSRKTRQEWDQMARERKRQRRHRGNPPGSRHHLEFSTSTSGKSEKAHDKRIGSKKPVPLLVDNEALIPKANALSPQEELAQLENDPLLDKLLYRLDEGEELDSEEQNYLDRMLDRIDGLMEVLGIELTDEEEEEKPQQDDRVKLLKTPPGNF